MRCRWRSRPAAVAASRRPPPAACRRATPPTDIRRRPAAAATAPATSGRSQWPPATPRPSSAEEQGDHQCPFHSAASLDAIRWCFSAAVIRCTMGASSGLLMSRGRGKGISNCSRIRPGLRRHQDDAVAEADRLAHVVRDEHDGLAAAAPDVLDVAIELLARHRVERAQTARPSAARADRAPASAPARRAASCRRTARGRRLA